MRPASRPSSSSPASAPAELAEHPPPWGPRGPPRRTSIRRLPHDAREVRREGASPRARGGPGVSPRPPRRPAAAMFLPRACAARSGVFGNGGDALGAAAAVGWRVRRDKGRVRAGQAGKGRGEAAVRLGFSEQNVSGASRVSRSREEEDGVGMTLRGGSLARRPSFKNAATTDCGKQQRRGMREKRVRGRPANFRRNKTNSAPRVSSPSTTTRGNIWKRVRKTRRWTFEASEQVVIRWEPPTRSGATTRPGPGSRCCPARQPRLCAVRPHETRYVVVREARGRARRPPVDRRQTRPPTRRSAHVASAYRTDRTRTPGRSPAWS